MRLHTIDFIISFHFILTTGLSLRQTTSDILLCWFMFATTDLIKLESYQLLVEMICVSQYCLKAKKHWLGWNLFSVSLS